MEKIETINIDDIDYSREIDNRISRTYLFVRQVLGSLSYEELVDILEKARENN